MSGFSSGGPVSAADAVAQAAADPAAFLDRLAAGAQRAMPAGAAGGVERVVERSLGDRLSGRAGRTVGVRLRGADQLLSLRLADGRRLTAEAAHEVGGVVISRRTIGLGEWLGLFAGQVAALAADAAGDAAAAGRALATLGLSAPVPALVVDARDVDGALQRFAEECRLRLPPDAAAQVARITVLLRETLPRVAEGTEAETLVRRTAITYLPETVRAYVALPAEWARTHALLGGTTASTAFAAQLAALETAAEKMRDASVDDDATALLLNGMFLDDRFGGA